MKKLLLIALLIVGCGDKNSTESSVHPLVGVWSLTEVKRTYNGEGFIGIADESYYIIFTISSDGSFRWEEYDYTGFGSEETLAGEWSIANSNEFTMITQVDDPDHDEIIEYTDIMYYTLDTNTLIISNIEEYEHGVTDGMYFTFQKQ